MSFLRRRGQVKLLLVKPHCRLSLQRHERRSETWVVLEGSATVEVAGAVWCARRGDRAHIPMGAWHRLSNDCEESLLVAEVQCGDYESEVDAELDIERAADDYGRAP